MMAISLNDHEKRIVALEKSSLTGLEIDCGKINIPRSNNGYSVTVKFRKPFSKVPSVTMNGSTGITSGGYSEGAVCDVITTTSFVFNSQWETGMAFELNWIAVSILYRYRLMISLVKEVLLCL